MKSLTIFFLGTGHTATKDGLLQRAYKQMAAAAVDLKNPTNTLWRNVNNVKCIFAGCGETDVTTHLSKIRNKHKRRAAQFFLGGAGIGHAGYKWAKKNIGGVVVGAGWDLTLKNAISVTDDFLQDIHPNNRVYINVIGHSRGSISAINYLNKLDNGGYGQLRPHLEVNAYLNDPVGGPAGGGSRLTVPVSPTFKCIRAVQMLVIRIAGRVKRAERAFYSQGVPDLKSSGFGSSDEKLIGEAQRTMGGRIDEERTVIYMPGTHGAAVAPDTSPQSKIGACLMDSFLHHVGVLDNRSLIGDKAPGPICHENYIKVQREVLGMATKRGAFFKKKGVSSAHAIRKNRKRLLNEDALRAVENNFLANYHNLVLLWKDDPALLGELITVDQAYKDGGKTGLQGAITACGITDQEYLDLIWHFYNKT